MIHEIYIIDNNNELINRLKESFKREVDQYNFKNINTLEIEIALRNIPSLIIIDEDATDVNIAEFCKSIRINEDDIRATPRSYERVSKSYKIYKEQKDSIPRSVFLNDELGAGSITALPFIETKAGDLSAYVATNVISITDGQIFLKSDYFHSGIRPAIDAGLSVSRVGGSAQIKAMKKVAGTLRLDLASYRELESFAQFGSDLDDATRARLARGERTVEVLKQGVHQPIPVEKQVCIIYALVNGFLDSIEVSDIGRFEKEFYTFLDNERPQILSHIRDTKDLPDTDLLNEALESFKAVFN